MEQQSISIPDLEKITESISKRNRYIHTALWGFALGILLASLAGIHPLVCVLIAVIGLASYIAEKHVAVLIALTAFSLGAIRYDIKDHRTGRPLEDIGIVISEPERREFDTRFVFKSGSGENALVSTDFLTPVEYGDKVKIKTSFKIPEVIIDENGRIFDYPAYLSKDDIYYTANYAKVEIISKGEGNLLKAMLLKIKNAFIERIRMVLPEPESSLLSGLLLAGKEAMPKGILEEFKNAGVIHIVVLSGYNLTIIAEFILGSLGFLGKRKSAIISAIAIALFTIMTGAAAPVVRASIMVLALLLGKILGREGNSGRILLVTATLMLIVNPKDLVFDPSFHLTFLAMMGILYVSPITEKWFEKLPERFKVRETLSVTVAIQMTVFPYLLYNTGDFSVVFLISNLLILLVMPYTMFLGFLATLVALVSIVLAWPIAYTAHLFLKWILSVSSFFGNLSFASVTLDYFPFWLAVSLYALLAFFLLRFHRERHLPGSQTSPYITLP